MKERDLELGMVGYASVMIIVSLTSLITSNNSSNNRSFRKYTSLVFAIVQLGFSVGSVALSWFHSGILKDYYLFTQLICHTLTLSVFVWERSNHQRIHSSTDFSSIKVHIFVLSWFALWQSVSDMAFQTTFNIETNFFSKSRVSFWFLGLIAGSLFTLKFDHYYNLKIQRIHLFWLLSMLSSMIVIWTRINLLFVVCGQRTLDVLCLMAILSPIEDIPRSPTAPSSIDDERRMQRSLSLPDLASQIGEFQSQIKKPRRTIATPVRIQLGEEGELQVSRPARRASLPSNLEEDGRKAHFEQRFRRSLSRNHLRRQRSATAEGEMFNTTSDGTTANSDQVSDKAHFVRPPMLKRHQSMIEDMPINHRRRTLQNQRRIPQSTKNSDTVKQPPRRFQRRISAPIYTAHTPSANSRTSYSRKVFAPEI